MLYSGIYGKGDKNRSMKPKLIFGKKNSLIILIFCMVIGFSLILSGAFLISRFFTLSGQQIIEITKPNESSIAASPKKHKPDLRKLVAPMKITLTFEKKNEVLDGSKLVTWLEKDEDGDYSVSDDKVRDYAAKLSEKYSTYKAYIPFTTSWGEKIEVYNKSFGWIFDEDYAVTELTDMIMNQRSESIVLTDNSEKSKKWWLRIAGPYSVKSDFGNTYAEVSIDSQYMWMYKDGKKVLETSVVTGNPNMGNDTPKGLYRVYSTARDTDLYGPGYNITVSYWMAFNDDIGFHDATWQDEFGGDVYLTNGSHGCVNLPLYAAEELYGYVRINMPVYVY